FRPATLNRSGVTVLLSRYRCANRNASSRCAEAASPFSTPRNSASARRRRVKSAESRARTGASAPSIAAMMSLEATPCRSCSTSSRCSAVGARGRNAERSAEYRARAITQSAITASPAQTRMAPQCRPFMAKPAPASRPRPRAIRRCPRLRPRVGARRPQCHHRPIPIHLRYRDRANLIPRPRDLHPAHLACHSLVQRLQLQLPILGRARERDLEHSLQPFLIPRQRIAHGIHQRRNLRISAQLHVICPPPPLHRQLIPLQDERLPLRLQRPLLQPIRRGISQHSRRLHRSIQNREIILLHIADLPMLAPRERAHQLPQSELPLRDLLRVRLHCLVRVLPLRRPRNLRPLLLLRRLHRRRGKPRAHHQHPKRKHRASHASDASIVKALSGGVKNREAHSSGRRCRDRLNAPNVFPAAYRDALAAAPERAFTSEPARLPNEIFLQTPPQKSKKLNQL